MVPLSNPVYPFDLRVGITRLHLHHPCAPGTEAPGISEERELNTETTGSPIIYNPHTALSIERQRQKLPVFKVFKLPNRVWIWQCGSVTAVSQCYLSLNIFVVVVDDF